MDELKIRAFENLIIEACNKTPIPAKVKYYVLRDVAQSVLNASNVDIALELKEIERQKESEVAEDGN